MLCNAIWLVAGAGWREEGNTQYIFSVSSYTNRFEIAIHRNAFEGIHML